MLRIQPQQQRDFCRITDTFRLATIVRFFKKSRRVGTDSLHYQLTDIVIRKDTSLFQCIETGLVHLHQILCQCTGLIRTDNGNSSHCFTSMHFAYKIISRKHTPHIQCQAKGNTHRKPLGDSNNNQRYGHHKIFQYNLGDGHVMVPPANLIRRNILVQIFGNKNNKSSGSYRKAYLANQFSQFSQLYIQRSRLPALFRTLAGYFPNLSGISYLKHFHHTMSIDYRRTAHHPIGSIRSLFIKIGFDNRFINNRFTRQVRFIDLQ